MDCYKARTVLEKLSGEAIESKMDEYSTVYGEVLLGLHRDIESLRKDVSEARKTLNPTNRDHVASRSNSGRIDHKPRSAAVALKRVGSGFALRSLRDLERSCRA